MIASALDTLFILHADHEMNCSTAAVLQVGSSLVDPYSAMAAGVAALYGVSHGGACEETVRMLLKIGGPENVPAFIEQVKAKKVKLSGFGHRIYRTSDPRSKISQSLPPPLASSLTYSNARFVNILVKQTAEKVFAVTGTSPLLETAQKLHDMALADDYFVSRHLFPNVDFWVTLFSLSLFPALTLTDVCDSVFDSLD